MVPFFLARRFYRCRDGRHQTRERSNVKIIFKLRSSEARSFFCTYIFFLFDFCSHFDSCHQTVAIVPGFPDFIQRAESINSSDETFAAIFNVALQHAATLSLTPNQRSAITH